jgi:hypothetical protein
MTEVPSLPPSYSSKPLERIGLNGKISDVKVSRQNEDITMPRRTAQGISGNAMPPGGLRVRITWGEHRWVGSLLGTALKPTLHSSQGGGRDEAASWVALFFDNRRHRGGRVGDWQAVEE